MLTAAAPGEMMSEPPDDVFSEVVTMIRSVSRLLGASSLLLFAVTVHAEAPTARAPASRNVDRRGAEKPPAATPAGALKIVKDFKVELLYSVPKETQGSWVNLCVDPKGRL